MEELHSDLFKEKDVRVFIKREDQIHPEISGNKWRKLKYNFLEARKQGFKKILTFGGAFSNHIAATAAAGRMYNFESIGIIRGDELNENSNPTLRKAVKDGMKLFFVSREKYKERGNPNWLEELEKEHSALIIPEGGSNELAIPGVRELLYDIKLDFDFIICPVGTGGTLAGIASELKGSQKAMGYSVLKGMTELEQIVSKLSGRTEKHFQINHDYHFEGYGKFDTTLICFIKDFYENHKIPLDPIYTGKMMFGLFDQIKAGFFSKNSTIVAIHTGGLQGIEGFNNKHRTNI